MKARLMAGQHCLKVEEELLLYDLPGQELEKRISELLPILSSAQLHQFGGLKQELRTFNSLLWVYIQRDGVLKRVVENIRLLWVTVGVVSINDFAHKLDLNPSFTGRVLSGDEIGLGGWNLANLMRMSGVLKVKPEALLLANLGAVVRQVAGTERTK